MTQDDAVRALWAHMSERFGSRVVLKSDSNGMKIVAWALGTFGKIDREAFMQRWTVTIGHGIYTPFKIGVIGPYHDLWQQVRICVHEHQHIVQLERDGWSGFGLGYITSSRKRAMFEAEAYRTDCQMEWWRSGGRSMPEPEVVLSSLPSYGCSTAEIRVAVRALEASQHTIRLGGQPDLAAQVAIDWLRKNRPAHLW